jgi:hypothetical protein
MTMKPSKSSPSPTRPAGAAPDPVGWPMGAVFALVALVTFVAYFPALAGDFLWDDAGHVTHPALRSWSGLGRIWFEVGATQQYYPLLHSAFWIEHRLWGDATVGYHLINVLWHTISACLLVAVLRRLAVPGACLRAASRVRRIRRVDFRTEEHALDGVHSRGGAGLVALRGRPAAGALWGGEPLVSGGAGDEDRDGDAAGGAARGGVVAARAAVVAR